MSLRLQIKKIDDVIQYISNVRDEANNMEKNVSDTVAFLRQNGLRTETADFIQQVYMGEIRRILGDMIQRMKDRDYTYLSNVKADLERSLMR